MPSVYFHPIVPFIRIFWTVMSHRCLKFVSSPYFPSQFIPNIPGQTHFRDAKYPSAAKPSSSRWSGSEETIRNSSLQNVRVFVLGGVLPAANLVTLVTIKQPAFLDCIYFFVFSIGSKLQKGVRCASIKNMSEDGGLISFQQIPVCPVDTKLVPHSWVGCWTCWTHTGVSDLHLSVVSPSRYLGSSWLKIPSVRRGTPKLESFRRVFPFLDHFCWRFSHFQIVQIGRDWQVHQVVCQGRQRFFSWFLMFLKGLAFAKLHQIIKTARGVCWKRNHL